MTDEERCAQWFRQKETLIQLAECFCGSCLVCSIVRPSILGRDIIAEQDSLWNDLEDLDDGDYDDDVCD